MSSMNRNPSRPLRNPWDNENGYDQRSARQAPFYPTVPPQAQMGLERQRSGPDQYPSPPTQPFLQRQPSRPEQPYPDQRQPYQAQPGRPPLQRQPSRPDGQQPLQRQPSRPDQYYPRPDQYPPEIAPSQPMAEPYSYKELPMQSAAPALMRAPSAPGSSLSPSDSQASLIPSSRSHANNMLIRGNSDDDLDKSDAFWRRFNASVVQQQLPDAEKSSWLERTEGKRSQHSRILWIVGIIFVLLAAGGIGIGVYLSFHSNSDSTRPTTLGGSANNPGAGDVAASIGGGGGSGGDGTTPTPATSFHVTPTNTVA